MPKGQEHVPVLEMADGKITHTLHLVFHSQDKVRHGILITHSKCDSAHFDEVECEWQYGEDGEEDAISVFRHKSTNLLVFSCDPSVKTWVSEDVADAIYDFVNFMILPVDHHILIFLQNFRYQHHSIVRRPMRLKVSFGIKTSKLVVVLRRCLTWGGH